MDDTQNTLIEQTRNTRFKPKGQAGGNKAGRPKGNISLVGELRRQLEAKPELKREIIENFIKTAKDRGSKRQLEAVIEIMNRIDGKVTETHKVELENPVTIQFVPAKAKESGQG